MYTKFQFLFSHILFLWKQISQHFSLARCCQKNCDDFYTCFICIWNLVLFCFVSPNIICYILLLKTQSDQKYNFSNVHLHALKTECLIISQYLFSQGSLPPIKYTICIWDSNSEVMSLSPWVKEGLQLDNPGNDQGLLGGIFIPGPESEWESRAGSVSGEELGARLETDPTWGNLVYRRKKVKGESNRRRLPLLTQREVK